MTPSFSSVIPAVRDRAGNDPIFQLNAEASQRATAGESILNATLGALMTDDGRLCTMPTVIETLARFQDGRAAGYAPIAGVAKYREAVIRDLFGDGLATRCTRGKSEYSGTAPVSASKFLLICTGSDHRFRIDFSAS